MWLEQEGRRRLKKYGQVRSSQGAAARPPHEPDARHMRSIWVCVHVYVLRTPVGHTEYSVCTLHMRILHFCPPLPATCCCGLDLARLGGPAGLCRLARPGHTMALVWHGTPSRLCSAALAWSQRPLDRMHRWRRCRPLLAAALHCSTGAPSRRRASSIADCETG